MTLEDWAGDAELAKMITVVTGQALHISFTSLYTFYEYGFTYID